MPTPNEQAILAELERSNGSLLGALTVLRAINPACLSPIDIERVDTAKALILQARGDIAAARLLVRS